MKDILRSVSMSFSMFSKIPMPRVEWKKENMRYALSFMPLIGIVIGLLIFGWHELCLFLGFGSILHAAGITLIPLLITGGIHLDGYCDTIDALSSHAEPEKKRKILKDPNAGAFAVIWCGIYLISYFAIASESDTLTDVIIAGLIHVVSRSVTAFCSIVCAPSSKEGLFTTFNDSSKKTAGIIITAVFFALSVLTACIFAKVTAAALIICPLFALAVILMAKKQFGGMSGDISGFMLQVLEIAALGIYIVLKAVF